MKRVFLLLILLCSVAFAAENQYMSASHTIIKDNIAYGEDAIFELTLKSKSSKIQYFSIDVSDTEIWKWVHTDPLAHGLSENKLYPDEEFKTKLVFKPDITTWVGLHNIRVNFKLKGGPTLTHIIPIHVGGSGYRDYVPDLKVEFRVDREIDPREEKNVEVYLMNRNFRDFDKVYIYLDSELLGDIKVNTSLKANEEKIIEVPLKLDLRQAPIKDVVKGRIEAGGYTFTPANTRFEVIDYTGDFKQELQLKKSFLKSEQDYVFTNDGNMLSTQTKRFKVGTIERMFLNTEPKGSLVHDADGNSYLSWELTLEPGESSEVTLVKSYRLFTFIVLLIAVVLGYYYATKSPIVIKKFASHVQMREGGISEVKILLDIKNNSKKNIQEMYIIDKIPNLAELKQDTELGTLSPSKILKHEREGTSMVKWKIEDLDPYEHRLITYKIKAKLPILGGLSLQAANVRYRTLKGNQVVVRSNNLNIG